MHYLFGRTVAAAVLSGAIAFSFAAPVYAQEDAVVGTVNGQPFTEADVALAESELDSQFDRLPPEQRRAQMLFQRFDLKAQRGGRHVQFGRRLLERHMPRGGVKGAQGGQRGQAITHFS